MNKVARQVAQALCAYFDDEFRHHREEQEAWLFPALRSRASGEAAQRVDALIAELAAEHMRIEQAWQELRDILSDIAACRPRRLSAEEVARFATLYRDHVEKEERRLITLAAQLLDLGDAMSVGMTKPR